MKDRIDKSFRWVVLGALVLGVPGMALAQSAGTAGGSAPSAQVGFEKRTQLSTQEELAQTEGIISRIDQGAATVRRQLDTARQGRDVVKSLCLSDKLSQIDVAGRSARERQTSLQSAAQRNDTELSNHEYNILVVLRQRTEQLSAEANQCIGEEVAFVGQTLVVTTIEGNMPTSEEATSFPVTFPTVVTAPAVPLSPH